MTSRTQPLRQQRSTMMRILSVLVALALLAPAAAMAQEPNQDSELRLSLSGASLRNSSPQTSHVSEDRGLQRFEVGLSYELARNLLVGVDFSTGSSSRFVSSGWDTHLSMRTVGARVRYLIDVSRFFRPYLTAGGGVVLGRAEVDLASATVSDNALGFYVDAAAGFEIFTPGRFSVGFATDSGYAYRTPIRFDDARPGGSDGPSTGFGLGDLSFRGYQWRGGVFLRAIF